MKIISNLELPATAKYLEAAFETTIIRYVEH
jgi:hypothetical protein